MNNLPKSWCVRNDGSQLFKDHVIKYMNNFEQTSIPWCGSEVGTFYGIDINGRIEWRTSSREFDVELKLDEFIKLLTVMEEYNITKKDILKLAELSKEVKESLKKIFPKAFETEGFIPRFKVMVEDNKNPIMETRTSGIYAEKGIYLNNLDYSWDVKTEEGKLILVPKKKTEVTNIFL